MDNSPSESKSAEIIIGVLGLVVGLAGIYLTVLTFPSTLNAVGDALTGAGLPEAFRGLAGIATIFCVIFTGLVALSALLIGLVSAFAVVFSKLSSPNPLADSIAVVALLFGIAATITAYLYSASAACIVGVTSLAIFSAIIKYMSEVLGKPTG